MKPGRHTIRLERDGPFPHLDKLAIVPRALPPGVSLDDDKSRRPRREAIP